jgi:hypothetical protein
MILKLARHFRNLPQDNENRASRPLSRTVSIVGG